MYRNGQRSGRFLSWYPNGEKAVDATYDAGAPVGSYAEWYEKNHAIKIQASYPRGSYTEYFEDGRLKEEGDLDAGRREGTWFTRIDDCGAKIGKCDDQRLIWMMYRDGKNHGLRYFIDVERPKATYKLDVWRKGSAIRDLETNDINREGPLISRCFVKSQLDECLATVHGRRTPNAAGDTTIEDEDAVYHCMRVWIQPCCISIPECNEVWTEAPENSS